MSVYHLLVLFSCLSFFCLFSLFLLCGFCPFLSLSIFTPSFYLFVFFILSFLFLRLLGFFKFDCTFQLVFLSSFSCFSISLLLSFFFSFISFSKPFQVKRKSNNSDGMEWKQTFFSFFLLQYSNIPSEKTSSFLVFQNTIQFCIMAL